MVKIVTDDASYYEYPYCTTCGRRLRLATVWVGGEFNHKKRKYETVVVFEYLCDCCKTRYCSETEYPRRRELTPQEQEIYDLFH